jgi:hypothetical protein
VDSAPPDTHLPCDLLVWHVAVKPHDQHLTLPVRQPADGADHVLAFLTADDHRLGRGGRWLIWRR